MNNVYTMRRAPATLTAAAGALMFGYAAAMLLQAQHDATERPAVSRPLSALKAWSYAEGGVSPTLDGNIMGFSSFEGEKLLSEASESFAAGLSQGMQSLGTEFATVIEDNFWDLVLR